MNMTRLSISLTFSSIIAAGCTAEDPTRTDPPSEEATFDEETTRAAVERQSWGLDADLPEVAAMLQSGLDVGTDRFGIPMTADEEVELDLAGRMAFASAVRESVVPYLESLDTSGGVYIDQQEGGSLVVLDTAPTEELQNQIVQRMPADVRGFRIERVDFTEAELRSALEEAWDAWAELAPPVALVGAGLDIRNNRLSFRVREGDVSEARAFSSALGSRLGVAVQVEESDEEISDTTCTSRDHCVSPSRAGTRIYKDHIDNYNECTMAFHVITNDGDVEFVTAGHCGYGGSNNWYLKDGTSNGLFLGAETKTLYHSGGQDIMRVNLPSSQQSHRMYGDTRVYGGSGACPVTGQAACASRGHSDVVDCGTVNTTWTSWVSDTAGVVVWGGDMSNVSSIPGDSGSPIYDKLSSTLFGTVGVLDTSAGTFAVLCKAETGLSITGKAY